MYMCDNYFFSTSSCCVLGCFFSLRHLCCSHLRARGMKSVSLFKVLQVTDIGNGGLISKNVLGLIQNFPEIQKVWKNPKFKNYSKSSSGAGFYIIESCFLPFLVATRICVRLPGVPYSNLPSVGRGTLPYHTPSSSRNWPLEQNICVNVKLNSNRVLNSSKFLLIGFFISSDFKNSLLDGGPFKYFSRGSFYSKLIPFYELQIISRYKREHPEIY